MMQKKLLLILMIFFVSFIHVACSTTSTETSDSSKDVELTDNDLSEDVDKEAADDEVGESDLSSDSAENKEEYSDAGDEQNNDNEDLTENESPVNNLPEEQGAIEEEPPQSGEPVASQGFDSSEGSAPTKVDVKDIKYLANQAGGTVVVETSQPAQYQTRENQQTNQFILEIASAHLPKNLKRPYIMKEFEGEFAAINAYQSPGSSTVRVVVQMRNPGTPLVQQEGNSLLILPPANSAATDEEADVASSDDNDDEDDGEDIADNEDKESGDSQMYDVEAANKDEKLMGARTLEEFFTGDNNKFYGRKISIQTKDADVRDALNFIAEYCGINMIISDDVSGTISLKLREVPWDQALITIMRAKRLGYIRQGNVIRISTLNVLQSESDSARAILQSQKALTPTRVKVIPVSYASSENLTKQLAPFLSENRGRIGFDSRTNALIITDTDEVINRVARLIKSLDVPPMQVMIEGKIVEAGESFQRSVGVNWNFDGENISLSSSGGANGGPLDLRTGLRVNPVAKEVLSANPLAMNLKIGRLDFLGELDAILSLAETDALVKILSSPRIVTINKEAASITQEGQVISKTSVADTVGHVKTTVERTPVTLNLQVTPQITTTGGVILDVQVKRQFAGGIVDQETLAREVNSREARTKVLVDNGQTAVIGGVYQSDTTQGETGVPVLKDIPILGWLFKNRSRTYQKNELLIFLTPRIINFGEQGKEEKLDSSLPHKYIHPVG